MNRFIMRIIAYVTLILIIGLSIVFISLKRWPNKFYGEPYTYFMWNFQKNRIGLKYPDRKNVIIGDSRGLASLAPNIIKHNFLNFSVSGTTPFEGYSILKKYLSNNNIDTLLISYSAMMFTGNPHDFEAATLPFNIVSDEDVLNLEEVEKKYNTTIDNQKPNQFLNIKRKLIKLHFPLYYRSDFINKMFTNVDGNLNKLGVFLAENGHCFYGQDDSCNVCSFEVTRSDDLDHYNINNVSLSYLDSIYSVCKERNIKAFFVEAPLNYTTYQKIQATKFYAKYRGLIESFKTRYPNMLFLNKYKFLPNTFFGDPNHFNQRGCTLFSTYIHEEFSKSVHSE